MKQRSSWRAFSPVFLLFVLLNAFFIAGRSMLARWNADSDVLIAGNLFLFIITFVSFLIAQKGLQQKNPHAFVRSVYISIIFKLFVCIIAAFAYIATYRKAINKPALFILMGLYLIYTFLEVAQLTRLLKQKRNAKERSTD